MENVPSYFDPRHSEVIERNARRAVQYQLWWKASRFCRRPVPTFQRGRETYRPCGACEACLIVASSSEHSRACLRAFHYSRKAWFVTLTYSDKKMRKAGRRGEAMQWADVKNYIRRLAYNGATVAWTGCLEAGEQHGRLHAHLMLFGNDDLTKRVVQASWKLGRSKVGAVRSRASASKYLAKYLTKESRIKSCRYFRTGYAAAAISYPHVATAFEQALQFSELDALGHLAEREPKVGFALNRSLSLAGEERSL